ncbi:toll/interleukin-1 receptor domain-containing protein [Vibrio chagasii]|uniref:toll/interleukin-1 receptor domain-containing protein n=1 Tax=Vibrio chagasii TaxID=170679 RepID=UPI002284822E|nr:toll/interleukin-1 receptor domain-containing protein [Vibrio chagasii]MCY9826723.1 toll/interleukin-1 receptor domain-containing protein [Vibrio chagasii]
MSKPVVFFCHSSVDKDYLSTFQNQIKNVTLNAIDIFQSSDGESVSFGNNWVHKLEENLNNATITFVFISPESLSSNWIQFEAGLSYGRGISVVPVGIKGVDVAKLQPPLSLLQGFNLSTEGGMNNVISTINKELNFNFSEKFNEVDFQVLNSGNEEKSADLEFIDSITLPIHPSIAISSKGTKVQPNANTLDIIQDLLEKHNHYCVRDDSKVLTNGMQTLIDDRSDLKGTIKIDPLSLKKFESFINEIGSAVYSPDLDTFWVDVYLEPNFVFLKELYKLSGRLEDYGVTHVEDVPNQLQYRGFHFFVTNNGRVRTDRFRLCVVFRINDFKYSDFIDLIQILRSSGVIYPGDK